MELSIGAISYSFAALAFAVLTGLLVFSQRNKFHGVLLILASAVTCAWAAITAYAIIAGTHPAAPELLEIARDGLWLLLLWKIFESGASRMPQSRPTLRRTFLVGLSVFGLVLLYTAALQLRMLPPALDAGLGGRIIGRITLAVLGLALVEQLYRNAADTQRWAIKHICLGLGGLFAFDFYLYSDALLFKSVDSGIWNARGMVNALIVPLIAVSAARNPQWSLDIAVSRGVVFHTATLFGAGVYLLVMAAAGYYIRIFGGSWGGVLQAAFLFGALVVLLLLLFSGSWRARLKVLLSKHFFSYKYDYREEWLRFTYTLSAGEPGVNMRERSLRAVAELVDSPAAMLWVEDERGFQQVAQWNMPATHAAEDVQGSLCAFLGERQWVVNLKEYAEQPDVYGNLRLPDWLANVPRAWLIVPLILHERLMGFIVLADARSPREFNWEDSDLLKTVGRQVAVYIAQIQATEALVAARQFESFNRLSTYVVHDLKNIVAQLSLLLANAQKHKHKAEFQEDMLATIENATQRMTRLLGQLRAGYQSAQQVEAIELNLLLEQVIREKNQGLPAPQLTPAPQPLWVVANKERLARVLGHLVQNAIEATTATGVVQVMLQAADERAVMRVTDNGKGMDETFIREQLFRPFATTKSGGMGIGAYECREYVRELKGEIQVSSAVGQGSTFTISLPLRKLLQPEIETQNLQGANGG
jgi:putative PEP-CTERM system histidine kinase